MQTITINRAGLAYAAITVNAESRASIAEQLVGSQVWRGLMVDGRFYPLVLCKHVNANPLAMVEATDAALADVQAGIASLQPPPAPEPMVTEAATCAALERLADENARSARTARAQGLKDDAAFFQRASNAYVKALLFYRAGLRPHPTERGGWLLPSQRPGEPPHLLTMDGDWTCSCSSGQQIHWASALIIGIEVAQEDMERFDDYIPDYDQTPADLGRRLAIARAQMDVAA